MKKQTNNKPVEAAPELAPAVPAVLPDLLKNHCPGMSQTQLALASQLVDKCLGIVFAVADFREQYTRTGEKYFAMCAAVRQEKLSKKATTALLLGLGMSKSRTSEIIKVSSVSDAIWDKYTAGSVGFKATLQLAAPQSESSDGGTSETETQQTETPAPRAKPVKIHDVSATVAGQLKNAMMLMGAKCLKDGEKTEYAHAIRVGKVSFYIAITASPANT